MVFPSFLVDNNNNKEFYLNLGVDVQKKFKIVSKEAIAIHTPLSSCNVQLHEDKAGLLYLDSSFIRNLFEKFTLKEKGFLHCFSTKPGELFVRPIHETGAELRYASQFMQYQHPNHLQSLHPGKRHQLYLPTTFGYATLSSGVKPSILKTSKGRFPVTTEYLGDRGLNFIGISWEDFYNCHFLDLAGYALFQYEGNWEFQVSFFSVNGCQIPFNISYPLGSINVEASMGDAASSGYAFAKHVITKPQFPNNQAARLVSGYPTGNIENSNLKGKSNVSEGKDKATAGGTSETNAGSFIIRLTKERINNNRLVLPSDASCIAALWEKKKVVLNFRGFFYDMELHHYTEFKKGNVEVPMIQLLGRWDIICSQKPTLLRKLVQFKVQQNQPKGSDAVSMTVDSII